MSFNLQWITKKHIPLFFNISFFSYIYLQDRLSYKKSPCVILHPFLKRFQLEKKFSCPVTKSADIYKKRWFANKKLAIWKNLPFWKIQKLFSMDIKSRNKVYIKQDFNSKMITQPLQIRLDVFAVLWWIRFSSAVITKINKLEIFSWYCLALHRGI